MQWQQFRWICMCFLLGLSSKFLLLKFLAASLDFTSFFTLTIWMLHTLLQLHIDTYCITSFCNCMAIEYNALKLSALWFSFCLFFIYYYIICTRVAMIHCVDVSIHCLLYGTVIYCLIRSGVKILFCVAFKRIKWCFFLWEALCTIKVDRSVDCKSLKPATICQYNTQYIDMVWLCIDASIQT